MEKEVRLVNWNLEWATHASRRGELIQLILADTNPDVICLTEASSEMMPASGYTITSHADYGYPIKASRRKVLLWSRQPWNEIDTFGNVDLPGGRFVTGISGGIRFVGVCIPWHFAHVSSGRKDRRPWEDHLQYLTAFGSLLKALITHDIPVCVVGDFNQRILANGQPARVTKALIDAFGDRFTIATGSVLDDEGQGLIDHVAVCGMHAQVERILPQRTSGGIKLSDHTGVVAVLTH